MRQADHSLLWLYKSGSVMLEGKQGTAHAAIPVRQENPAGCAADASWKTAISSQAPATRQTVGRHIFRPVSCFEGSACWCFACDALYCTMLAEPRVVMKCWSSLQMQTVSRGSMWVSGGSKTGLTVLSSPKQVLDLAHWSLHY